MTEPDKRPNANASNRPGPVTAARRSGNLETIRKQSGWKDFPDCVPLSMRTTKSGKVTDFGNTKLRVIERIAVNADFSSAFAYLRGLTEDGSRLLSLKDLECCAAHFDTSKKASSKRESSSAPLSTGPSQSDDEDTNYQLLHDPLEAWSHVGFEDTSIPLHAGPPMSTLKRPSPDNASFHRMSQSPLASTSKKPRVDTFFDPHTADYLCSLPEQDLGSSSGLSLTGFHQPTDVPSRHSTPHLPLQSVHQNPARALLSLHPHAGSIFTNLNTAFDELLARVEDQQQLVKSALDQLHMANGGLGVAASIPSEATERDLEAALVAAQRIEARARLDLQQARSARDVIDIQYGHVGTSLSRALLGTVCDEYTRAEVAMARAQADVEAARQRLNNANNREQAMRRAREVAEVGIDQLQRQTRFWLKRLAEAGVKLTDHLNTLQNCDTNQAPPQG